MREGTKIRSPQQSNGLLAYADCSFGSEASVFQEEVTFNSDSGSKFWMKLAGASPCVSNMFRALDSWRTTLALAEGMLR